MTVAGGVLRPLSLRSPRLSPKGIPFPRPLLSLSIGKVERSHSQTLLNEMYLISRRLFSLEDIACISNYQPYNFVKYANLSSMHGRIIVKVKIFIMLKSLDHRLLKGIMSD